MYKLHKPSSDPRISIPESNRNTFPHIHTSCEANRKTLLKIAMFINTTASEVQQAGNSIQDSVLLGGGGYVAALGIYHELHCLVRPTLPLSSSPLLPTPLAFKNPSLLSPPCFLPPSHFPKRHYFSSLSSFSVIFPSTQPNTSQRKLRLYLHAPTYYPHLTPENLAYERRHLGHCLETLRQSLMCTADLSLYNFHWPTPDADRPIPITSSVRKCADWETIDKWAAERRVDYDPVLVRDKGETQRVQL
jgi:hypothetical protein